MVDYQVTLICASGKYKPVSCIIKSELGTPKADLIAKGIQKICNKRYWNKNDLKKYEYTKVKVRRYDKVKIEQENKERYEQIKKERGWV